MGSSFEVRDVSGSKVQPKYSLYSVGGRIVMCGLEIAEEDCHKRARMNGGGAARRNGRM